jgi:hypothetical protein
VDDLHAAPLQVAPEHGRHGRIASISSTRAGLPPWPLGINTQQRGRIAAVQRIGRDLAEAGRDDQRQAT